MDKITRTHVDYRAKAHPHPQVAASVAIGDLRKSLMDFGFSPSDCDAEIERRQAHGLAMTFDTTEPTNA